MHTRQDRWIQTELVFTLAKNATKPNPFEIISLQTTRKENNWKTEETLARAVVTLETKRIKGSNPWCLWWWWWIEPKWRSTEYKIPLASLWLVHFLGLWASSKAFLTDRPEDFLGFGYFFLIEVPKCVLLFQNHGQALTCHHKSVGPAVCHSGILHHLCSGQSIRKRQSVSSLSVLHRVFNTS